MRCSKCGFISFDYPSVCAGCKTDLSELAKQFEGTASQVEAPFFLGPALGPLSVEGDIETPEVSSGYGAEAGIESGIDFEEDTTVTAGAEAAEFDFQTGDEDTGAADFEFSDAEENEGGEDIDFGMSAEEESAGGADFEFQPEEEEAEIGDFDFQLEEEGGVDAAPAGEEDAEIVFEDENSTDFELMDEDAASEEGMELSDPGKHPVGLEDLDLADLDLSEGDTDTEQAGSDLDLSAGENAPADTDLDFSFDDEADEQDIEFIETEAEEEKS